MDTDNIKNIRLEHNIIKRDVGIEIEHLQHRKQQLNVDVCTYSP